MTTIITGNFQQQDEAQQDTAIRILREHGAIDIERPEGTIVAGEWTDFNPLTPLRRVAG